MEIYGKDLNFSTQEVAEYRKALLKRMELYRSYGYDQFQSREFILKKAMPIKGSVLEIGTGKGYLAAPLSKLTENLITLDVSEEDFRSAALRIADVGELSSVIFKFYDGVKIPCSDSAFDLVISANSYHHFNHHFTVLREIIRVAKGKIIITDFNRKGFDLIQKIHHEEGHTHDEGASDFASAKEYFIEMGFQVEEILTEFETIYIATR